MTVLTTTRHLLRPLTPDDLAAFHAIWGDPQVIWWGHDETPEASAREINSACHIQAADWRPVCVAGDTAAITSRDGS